MARLNVIFKPTGQKGTVEDYEFDPKIYTQVDSSIAPAQSQSMSQSAGRFQDRPNTVSTQPITPTPPTQSNRGIDLGQTGNLFSGINSVLDPFKAAQLLTKFLLPQTTKIATGQTVKEFTQRQNARKNETNDLKGAIKKAGLDTLDLLGTSAKPAAEIASITVPAGTTAKGALALGGLSGGLRGASDLNNTSLPEIGAKVGGGALGGGIAGVGVYGAGKLLSTVTKGTSKMMMNSEFKEPIKNTKAAVSKGQTLGEEALQRGEKGTSAEAIFNKANSKVQSIEDDLQNTLLDSNKKVSLDNVRKAVDPLIKEYRQAGNTGAADAIEQRLAKIEAANGGNLPAPLANEVKRSIYDEISKAYGTEASANTEGLKGIARAIKDELAGIPGVAQSNKDLSYYGRIADSMRDKIVREGRNGLFGGLGRSVVLGGGLAAAPFTSGASLLPAIGLGVGGTTAVKTGGANALNALGNMSLPGIQQLARIGGAKVGEMIGQGALPVIKPPNNQPPYQDSNNQNPNPPVNMQEHNTDTVPQPQTQSKEDGIPLDELGRMYERAMLAGDTKTAAQIKDLADFKKAGSGGADAATKKRVRALNQVSSVVKRLTTEAMTAPEGLAGSALAIAGKIPGIEGGQAEYLDRDTRGFARVIASALASEVGVATDKDVERWLGLMPQVGDTLKERKDRMIKMLDQIETESQGFDTPIDLSNIRAEIEGNTLPPITPSY